MRSEVAGPLRPVPERAHASRPNSLAASLFLMNQVNAILARLLLPLLILVPSARSADSTTPLPDMVRARDAAVFTAYFENDVLANADQHYTAGTKLSWLSSDYSAW